MEEPLTNSKIAASRSARLIEDSRIKFSVVRTKRHSSRVPNNKAKLLMYFTFSSLLSIFTFAGASAANKNACSVDNLNDLIDAQSKTTYLDAIRLVIRDAKTNDESGRRALTHMSPYFENLLNLYSFRTGQMTRRQMRQDAEALRKSGDDTDDKGVLIEYVNCERIRDKGETRLLLLII